MKESFYYQIDDIFEFKWHGGLNPYDMYRNCGILKSVWFEWTNSFSTTAGFIKNDKHEAGVKPQENAESATQEKILLIRKM